MGFIDNGPDGAAGDPVIAAGRNGLVLFGTLAVKFDEAAGTFTEHLGTRVSTDGGRTFTAFGTAQRIAGPSPPSEFLDKEWLAIDNSDGPFRGSAYLAWVHNRSDGTDDLLLSASQDGGRTYLTPQLLEHSVRAESKGSEQYAQLAVRPTGTVDATWNGMRRGNPAILHAFSTDGGASFSEPKPVVHLNARASRIGIVSSLAVSPSGRLALCWSQSRRRTGYRPRVLCQKTDKAGRWNHMTAVLPHNRARQYLPAATFQGERLWVALYVSDAATTRMIAIPSGRRGFAAPVTLNRWPVPSNRICAPHPPDCSKGQTFIGDYIGAIATESQVVVSYIEPVVAGARHNRVLVSRLANPEFPQSAGG